MMPFAALLRLNLSLAVSLSALTGFVVAHRGFDAKAIVAFVGVLLLSCAASALNQVQERRVDAVMERTRRRPLQMGRITSRQAVVVAVALGLGGLIVLFMGGSPPGALIGAGNLFWYHAVYTPLKRRTRFALFAGALTGALSPIIGGAVAGDALAPGALLLALFMYLWQIPHFLMILARYGNEYEHAGLPSLASTMREGRSGQIIGTLALVTAASTLLFPLFRVVNGVGMMSALLALGGVFAVLLRVSLAGGNRDPRLAFRVMYLYQGSIFALLMAGQVAPLPW